MNVFFLHYAAEKEAAASMGVDAYDLINREAAQSPIGANKLHCAFLGYVGARELRALGALEEVLDDPMWDEEQKGTFSAWAGAMRTEKFRRKP